VSFWTGSLCAENGVYRGGCQCGAYVTFVRGNRFPICPSCQLHVPWTSASCDGGERPASREAGPHRVRRMARRSESDPGM
jgi:hypothetical protein